MQYYINSNGQQIGPIEESDVIAGIASGQFSPNDLGIPTGGSKWDRLSALFPNSVPSLAQAPPVTSAVAAVSPKKKGSWGKVLGVLGILLLFILLIGGVIGFFVYRNLFPGDSVAEMPDQVKDFKLEKRNPGHGDIWGSKVWYAGMYKIPPSDDVLVYLLTIYNSESEAQANLEKDLAKDCTNGDKPIRFTFEKNGTKISDGATCYGAFYVLKGNRIATIGRIGKSISIDQWTEFMENIPLNDGAKVNKGQNKQSRTDSY